MRLLKILMVIPLLTVLTHSQDWEAFVLKVKSVEKQGNGQATVVLEDGTQLERWTPKTGQ